MVKFLIEEFGAIFIIIVLITQILIPSFVPSVNYWWAFKGWKKKTTPEDLKEVVDEKVNEFKEVKTKVEDNLGQATELKKKVDEV